MKEVAGIKLYNVRDLHEALGVNERTIREWFNKKRLRGVKISKEWYVTEENLKAFLSGEEGRGKPQDETERTRRLRSLRKQKGR
ncbi:MAG TPA: helix-turn-helix domain-containing protein [Syntrophorhabdales bacterium]|nr:helix-turn-helix domain-containing protein [Syntrophorhabdales bacterium]